ncbi:MAG: coenzyme F420-0:L-glutamate ligase [Candidatus Bathyarchaeota archaeon]|nr:coenzyme F420-0:L-glutamate ligase [Candidatus Bathyarchaeum tardum]WGM88566.1 MAG: coenzyme F420-0:L-glutamate ligase [Candidatus Bathyarchaeum tardum]WNZ29167.1 MAG: coenzyme F420-0:L-glutamate ligase [Candidatus Bathyarchaeota archaeon]
MNKVEIFPVTGLPIIKEGDDLARLICEAAENQGTHIKNGDVIVVTHVIVSRAEGKIVDLNTITPSKFAETIAQTSDKDPRLVEVVLRESKSIVRMRKGKLITETKHGIVCANSGIDQSNVAGNDIVAPLPEDSDLSAQKIRKRINEITAKDVAVIVSDTHGRPLRHGEINIALGTSGFEPLRDRRGEIDLFGYTIRIKRTAIADELASAAELVIGQTNEGMPVAIIRGYDYPKSETANATIMTRSPQDDLFI